MSSTEQFHDDLLQRMAPAEKFRQLTSLLRFARRVKRAGLRALHPDWSDAQIEAAVREAFLHGRT